MTFVSAFAALRRRARLDPDDPESRSGERLIVIVACCEAAVSVSACALGLWLYLRAP